MKFLKYFKFLYLTMVFTGCCCEGDEPSECRDVVRGDLIIEMNGQDFSSYTGNCTDNEIRIDPCAPAPDYGSDPDSTNWYGIASFQTPDCCSNHTGTRRKWMASKLNSDCDMELQYVQGVSNDVEVRMDTPAMACHPNGTRDMQIAWDFEETIPKSFSGVYFMNCQMSFSGVY